ncbi:KDEL motif-containing protein 1 [Lingula anatina]|uniref:KDEL motif-containing protein 1 n=1 Tax=Lingula anatina TaxID=7574 RepID=A0A1S3JHD9_LINAN|nr:KDEL motif-containing protein 1 [Lingula anatina]|eukprot:XP_013409314.1 KDEL motif-containing protein 1 [Lingula anatina]
MQCPKSYRQIKQDLSLYKNIDMEKVEKDLVSRFSQRGSFSLCHYVVKNNKIYRKTHGEHVGFKMFMDAMLLSLTRKVKLPDIEFFVNLGDWPLEKRKTSDNPQPVFSWCGSDDTRDIVMPTYDVTESTLETLGRCEQESGTLEMPTYQTSESDLKNTCRVSLDLMSVQGNTGPKWENKTEVALFRGRDSRQERLDLAEMSLKHPDLIDAKLTNMFFFKKDESKHGPLVKHISFFDFFKWKYQLNIDGTVAAYRFPYLLAGGSLVFKQDSPYYEHFYKQLEPYKHYVPFKRDLSDLMEKLIWAKEHDEEAKEIARNGQLFVRDNLMAVDIFCYHVVLFKEYAKLLKSPVEVRDGMELVDQPSDHESKCECGRKTKKAKKAKNKKDEL